LLSGLGVQCQPVEANADLKAYDILVVGKGALTVDGPGPDVSRVREGLKVVLFEQTSDVLEKRFGFRIAEYGLRQLFPRVPDHPLLAGLGAENLRDWRGEATIMPPRLKYTMSPTYQQATPVVKWCDIEVPRAWRCGNRGNVASVLIEKPAQGRLPADRRRRLQPAYSPLMEYREGRGVVLFCQVDVSGRTESDPAAETLALNLVRYALTWKPAAGRNALYVGEPAGKRHLEFSGIGVTAYEGGKLSPDQVLIVGPGGSPTLANHGPAVGEFVHQGGHVLALGLDQAEANSLFLGSKIGMKKAEHIAAFFEPFGADSPFAGVGPADVPTAGPRELPLVSSGATVVGDGVLAKSPDANVVFCQLAPYNVTRAEGAVPSFAVNGDDAVDGKQSALLTLGTATDARHPVLGRR